jgi:hypothetical protein
MCTGINLLLTSVSVFVLTKYCQRPSPAHALRMLCSPAKHCLDYRRNTNVSVVAYQARIECPPPSVTQILMCLFNPLKTICNLVYILSAYCTVNTLDFGYKKVSYLMLCKAKVVVCSEIRTKHINAMWAPRRIF